MLLRRVLLTLLMLLGLGLLAGPALGAESIPSYSVDIEARADTSLAITETITYDFSDTEGRHGIFRDIVVADDDSLGRTRLYEAEVLGVTMDGSPVPYEVSEEGNVLRVKVGDADVTVNGTHVYVIEYSVANALRVVTADDVTDPQMPAGVRAGDVELFWDVVENTFEVPILDARATVTGPAAPLAARCMVGDAGSTDACAFATEDARTSLGPVALADTQFLTTAVVFPATAFTQRPVEVFASRTPLLVGIALGALAFVGLAFVPPILALAWRRRDRGVPELGTPVQFEPPDRLAAAPMAAAWRGNPGSARPRVLVAALLDLAARGLVTIDDTDKLTVRRVDGAGGRISPWESQLLGTLFRAGGSARLDEYDEALAAQWSSVMDGLVADAESAGRRNAAGGAPDRRWNVLFVVALVGVAALIVAAVASSGPLFAVAAGMTAGGLLGGFVARAITPRQETAQSAQFIASVLGFERLLATDASAARREFAQRLGLPAAAILATMLPYAVVFDLEESWVGAFPDLTPEELRATGIRVASIGALTTMVGSATTSAASALTAPSSGSGSGGSAGGGGGGGGGGAW